MKPFFSIDASVSINEGFSENGELIKKEIYNEQYVKKIQTSKINLSFTSYDNLDEYPYRLLEIIMSGGFCLHQLNKGGKIQILKKTNQSYFYMDYWDHHVILEQ